MRCHRRGAVVAVKVQEELISGKGGKAFRKREQHGQWR